MAYVSVFCATCGAYVNVNDSLTNQTPTCPKCRKHFDMVTVGDAEATELQGALETTLLSFESKEELLAGRYRIEKDSKGQDRELGEGGMGKVLLAFDTKLKRKVALKVPKRGDEKSFRRLVIEAEAAANFHHPNSCPIFEISDEPPFLAMAFIDGETLSQRLEKGETLSQREAAELVRTLARVLSVAHQSRIIHRDLKASNVMVTRDGTPILMDFGLAKQLDHDGNSLTNDALGTPAYMSPEQARNDKDIGPPTDIYSLGVLLYRLLTGSMPFHANHLAALFDQIFRQDPVPPSQLVPDIDPRLEFICLKAMSKSVADRYPDMAAMGNALHNFLNDRPLDTSRSGDSHSSRISTYRVPTSAPEPSAAGLSKSSVSAETSSPSLSRIKAPKPPSWVQSAIEETANDLIWPALRMIRNLVLIILLVALGVWLINYSAQKGKHNKELQHPAAAETQEKPN